MYGTIKLDLQRTEGRIFVATVRGAFYDVRTCLQNAIYVNINLQKSFLLLNKRFPQHEFFPLCLFSVIQYESKKALAIQIRVGEEMLKKSYYNLSKVRYNGGKE
jgi:hypothetical protein